MTSSSAVGSPPDSPTDRFRADVLAAGLMVDLGGPGLYGTSAAFEAIATAVSALVVRTGADQKAESWRFPAVFPRTALENTGYLGSFPDLIGSVHVFSGDEKAHAGLLAQLAAGSDWTTRLEPADVALCSAACHPLYPIVDKNLRPGESGSDVLGLVFRNEPSPDPARMQTFRQHEFVYLGEARNALAHRDDWLDRGEMIFTRLGLRAARVVANDPFFGRAGRMLTSSQRADELKYELVATVADEARPTAIASSNLHRDHFGSAFDIRTAAGAPAHSACVGFGLERITLALLSAHGLVPRSWPSSVQDALWP